MEEVDQPQDSARQEYERVELVVEGAESLPPEDEEACAAAIASYAAACEAFEAANARYETNRAAWYLVQSQGRGAYERLSLACEVAQAAAHARAAKQGRKRAREAEILAEATARLAQEELDTETDLLEKQEMLDMGTVEEDEVSEEVVHEESAPERIRAPQKQPKHEEEEKAEARRPRKVARVHNDTEAIAHAPPPSPKPPTKKQTEKPNVESRPNSSHEKRARETKKQEEREDDKHKHKHKNKNKHNKHKQEKKPRKQSASEPRQRAQDPRTGKSSKKSRNAPPKLAAVLQATGVFTAPKLKDSF